MNSTTMKKKGKKEIVRILEKEKTDLLKRIDSINTLLDSYKGKYSNVATVDSILDVVCSTYNVTGSELKSKGRTLNLAGARQVAMYLLHRRTKLSSSVIGKEFNRDHTTALHAIKRTEGLIEVDKKFKEEILAIETKLDSSS